MTEAEWHVCTDPALMQDMLRRTASVRRMCLFVCACCRRSPGMVADPRRVAALATVEAFVEGGAWEKRGEARALTQEVLSAVTEDDGLPLVQSPGGAILDRELLKSTIIGLGDRVRCELVREVMGNPFEPVPLNPRWLHWEDDTVLRVARTLYDTRQFEGLSVLGDALLEAGCGHRDILMHCRQPGPHVRGCWLLDRLLGKQ
jgi:hypothetical protein